DGAIARGRACAAARMGRPHRAAAGTAAGAGAPALERQPAREAPAHARTRPALAVDDARAARARTPRHAPLARHAAGEATPGAGPVRSHPWPAGGRAQGDARALEDDDRGGTQGLGGRASAPRPGGLTRRQAGAAARSGQTVFASSSSSQSNARPSSRSNSETKL